MKCELSTDILRIVIPDTYGSGLCNVVAEDCWNEAKQIMVNLAEEYIKENLAETDFKDAKLTIGEFCSPRYYNNGTDWINFDLEFNDAVLDVIISKATDEFFEYIKANYSSYPGFISFYPVTRQAWLDALHCDGTFRRRASDRALAICQYIEWQLKDNLEKSQSDYLDEVFEKISQNGLEDYDDEEESA